MSAPTAERLADDGRMAAIRRALARWREQHRHGRPAAAGAVPGEPPVTVEPGSEAHDDPDRAVGNDIDLVDVELLRAGRPGVLDVVAEMDGRLAHAVLGLRRPGDELELVGSVEEPALGLVEDSAGMAVMVDGLHDAEAARALLETVAGTAERIGSSPPAPDHPPHAGGDEVVSVVQDDDEMVTLSFGRRCTLSVFPWLRRGPHPGVSLLAALDEAGFNHLAAPVAIWRRSGRDLGIVQERLAGASGGWALALTSLRDLFGAGGSPDVAGGDFGPEALALGTMAARMHLALDRAFGRRPGDTAAWADEVEAAVAQGSAGPTARGTDAVRLSDALVALRTSGLHPPMVRTHGDLHLGRIARTDHGWVLADCMPGGVDPSGEPLYRSPLADVADMLWSLHQAAVVAVSVRGPVTAPSRLTDLATAWEARNRRAFLAGYLSTPGMGGLVPSNRELVRWLIGAFEIARAARHPAALSR